MLDAENHKHLRAPAQTRDDCHQPLLQAITTLIVERAEAGLLTKIMKVKSHIGIHGNEMADNCRILTQRFCIVNDRYQHRLFRSAGINAYGQSAIGLLKQHVMLQKASFATSLIPEQG